MAIGQDLAKTFQLPGRQVQQAMTPSPNVATGGAGQGFQMPFDPAQGLALANDDLVQDYYDKYNKVRSFAASMQKQGIDVTAPDFDNQASIEANQLFQKATADLMRVGDMLQEHRKTQEKVIEPGLAEGDIEAVTPEAYGGIEGNTVDTARSQNFQERFSSISLAPEVKEVNNMFSKSFDSKDERSAAQAELDKLYKFYGDKLKSSKTDSEKLYAQRQLNALGKALYNPNKDQDQTLAWNKWNDKKKKEASQSLHRLSLIQRIFSGDTQILEAIDGINNVKILPSGKLSYRERVGTENGVPQYRTVYVDMTGEKGRDKGMINVNELINRMSPSAEQIGYEKLMDHHGTYVNNFGQVAANNFGTEYWKKENAFVKALQGGAPGEWKIPLVGASLGASRGDVDAFKDAFNTIQNRVNQAKFNMPPGVVSEEGIESMGGEMVESFEVDRRPKNKGGDRFVMEAIKNGEKLKFNVDATDYDKIAALLSANPEIVESLKRFKRVKKLSIPGTPKGSYTVQELRDMGYNDDEVEKLIEKYDK